MKHCPECEEELDEVYYSTEPARQPGKRLPPGQLKYACPGCGNEWRVTDDKTLVPFSPR